MAIEPTVIKYISDKMRIDITTPSGAAYLRNDIESVTGQNLSLNTVKRLTGVLYCESKPREVTLDILARYVGCESWLQLLEFVNQSVSSFDSDKRFIDMVNLTDSALVEIAWSPNRRILLKHIGGASYKVLESENSKIVVNDILYLSQLAVGFPLMAHQIIRNGINMGSYTAAARLGINRLVLL